MFDQKTYVDAKWRATAVRWKQLETNPSWSQLTTEQRDRLLVDVIDAGVTTIIAELRADHQSNAIIAAVAAEFGTYWHKNEANYAAYREVVRQQYLTELDADGATILPFSTLTARPSNEGPPKP